MSIVLKMENGDLMWFDAVEQFGLSYKTSVTKHPVATGGFISDHSTNDNVVVTINAVLSDADFNINRPTNLGKLSTFDLGHVSTDENGLYKPQEKQYTTAGTPKPVVIQSRDQSLNKILPEVIAQFTKDSIPVAVVTPQSKAKSARAVKRELIRIRDNREQFQVLELLDDFVIESYGPCVFTSLSFNEDSKTGDGVYPNMVIEQVTYTNLQEVKIKIKTANKGRKSGDVNKKDNEAPPANNPVNMTNRDSSGINKTSTNVTASSSSSASTP